MTRRLDLALHERGLARSRAHARQLIDAGQVMVNDRPVAKAAAPVGDHDRLTVRDLDPYVSRAAHKLLGALSDLGGSLGSLRGQRVLDAGASTGGFTQVLLEAGAARVLAVDVGHDQLHPSLRDDPRVEVYERTNLRDLEPAVIGGEPVDLVVADVSFISLLLLLEPLTGVLSASGRLLVMVKPQFEVGREQLGPGGVVREPDLHRRSVTIVVERAAELGWRAVAAAPSRRLGPAGNREFFVLFRADGTTAVDVERALGL